MILCIGPTPAAQRVMSFGKLKLDAVNRALATLDGAAGKSVNVAKVLRELGAQVVATGFVGGRWAESIVADLRGRGIETDFIDVSVPTRQCITVLDQSSGEVTELVQESQPVAAADYEKLMGVIEARLGAGCEALVASGTITSGGPAGFYGACVKAARLAGVLAAVDAKGEPLLEAVKARPDLVKPNRDELAASVGRTLSSEADVLKAMRDLAGAGAERVVVTAGREPTLAWDGSRCWRIEVPMVKAINPIGSGDAFTAGLVWRTVLGDDLGEACRWAAAAGAANALGPMPGDLIRSDVEVLLRQIKAAAITA